VIDLWKKNEYVYVGDPIPKIDKAQHADFILHYQKSILLSLAKKNLLTPTQIQKCFEELECKR
jgi:hypothetical protein